jgi:transposase
MYYVGIDWADQKHDIVVLDDAGKPASKPFTIKKSQQGFSELLTRLRNLSADPNQFKIGIETPHNLLVDYLVDLNYPVYSIFPGSMKSFRKRYRSSGARDDNFDAYVIADVLRTDTACWRKVDFGSDLVREMRILVRDHHHLIAEQTALTNSFRSTLKEYYPEYVHFFVDVACASSLAFILAFPDFDTASQLSKQQLADFFKEQGLRNSKKIVKIFNVLHQEHINVAPIIINTKREKALTNARQLSQLADVIKQYENRIKELLHQHPDSKIFLSYPGVAEMLAARLLAFFGDNRALYADASELQQLAGTCPVTEKSGKVTVVYFRRACNKFYRDLMHNLAFSTLTRAKWAMAYYQQLRAQQKRNAHALRCLANIHLKILFAMWKNKTLYDENIFLAQRTRNWLSNKKKSNS